QIVGAHHYSGLELARRFLRKNRAAVTVAASALVALVAFGAWDYWRILAEKERAVAAEHLAQDERGMAVTAQAHAEAGGGREAEGVERLKLDQARAALEVDPALALSWLKSLRPGPKTPWGAVRTLAADALSRGVPVVLGAPWSTPRAVNHAAINQIAFSPD